ncbi:MAG TPA: helix-turn-helix domain-containing protein [Alphaproteobacteria bacterium]|nr:helix-turn-helix domain-containing protein [Alphaproteobacteria bacterium]
MTAHAQSGSEPNGASGAPTGRAPDAHQRVGVFLRETRQARGLSVEDVSTVLRIRESHIGAIEDGRFRDLPGSTYATGFVRSYARYLDLDETAVVERFKDEVAAVEAEAELVLPYATRERRFPSPALLVASVLVAVVVYGAWHILSGAEQKGGPAADVAAGSTESPASPAAGGGAGAGAADTNTGDNAGAGGATVVPADQTEPTGDKAPAKPANDKASFDLRGGAVDLASVTPAVPVLPVDPEVLEADAAFAGIYASQPERMQQSRPHVLVRALNDSWIQLSDASGGPMYSHILRKGEDFAVPSRPGVLLTVGNTGTVRLVVDGRVLPALGPDGTLRRDIALDPERLSSLH